MTEAEWRASDDPDAMLHAVLHVWKRPSSRKLRLFACACCRHVPALTGDPDRAAVVAVVERFADGLATGVELSRAFQSACGMPGWPILTRLSPKHVEWVRSSAARAARDGVAERKYQAALLRDVFGLRRPRPSRSMLRPEWLTAAGIGLAWAAYEEDAFDRLPILADALEEVGCDDPDILGHCRGSGPHVRGCWVVDLVLGKE